jgi:glutathione S-transferase
MTGPPLILYMAPGSSSMAAHVMLREVGAAFELRPLSFARKEQRDPAFLAVNPEGKVPTLLLDGGQRPALTEVAGILFYLARRFPAAGLLPEDAEAEGRVVSWMSFLAATVHPSRRAGAEAARAAYGLAERRLGGRDWAVGERCSIADIHLFRLFWRYSGAAPRPDRADFPALSAHQDRMLARPAVRETIAVESAIGYELPA